MSDGCSSPRLDVYGHTLQEIEPELSTFRVDRQEGQNGQVILIFSKANELFVSWQLTVVRQKLLTANLMITKTETDCWVDGFFFSLEMKKKSERGK